MTDATVMPCEDCGVDVNALGEYSYMLLDDLWKQVAPDDPGGMAYFLCVDCLEQRLGRRLLPTDFSDVPLNLFPWADSERLWSRKHPR